MVVYTFGDSLKGLSHTDPDFIHVYESVYYVY